ncbi:AAA family ATPase [Microbacterium azadirachtae]|uniref:AAA family ATPase n=1 Tax=Microbacterium azadirachtae TaxID=582680 RepID=UPI001587498A|nr:AAA family ATPase [Microbacterium azadirachtae]
MNELISMVASIGRGQARTVRTSVTAMVSDLSQCLGIVPRRVQTMSRNARKPAAESDIRFIVGLSRPEWRKTIARLRAAKDLLSTPLAARIAAADDRPLDLQVATRLAVTSAASPEVAIEVLPPEYDRSEERLHLAEVAVSGFRGSAHPVTLSIADAGESVDVLLWGDNGMGKSTLIDGLEFALQGRVDRSADFNSTLRSSVRNLSSADASASVKLSDGSSVSRSLVRNAAGRDEPSTGPIRPGFRIAPLVIRRADILRFLDTESLSRGTVFFDYFPDPDGSLGMRPDEELRSLEEEQYVLRLVRDDGAQRLMALFPDETSDLRNATALNNFVDRTQRGSSSAPSPLSAEAARLIAEVSKAQQRLSTIKKKLDAGIQKLNPIAYQKQLARVVPILQSATGDLTTSFKKVTNAEHIKAIKVLVARSGPVSLDVVVEFDDGSLALPQQVFSEGYKDLVALLFFLTVAKRAAALGQARVLVLDDALQSVDATIRLGLMEHVLDEFHDWQLIITGHDRAWLEQVRGLFQRKSRRFAERHVHRWSYSTGIQISGPASNRAQSLKNAMSGNDDRLTTAAAGLLLEEVAQQVSWRIGSSVTRRQGDRYTLGDLWPSIAKHLKQTQLNSTIEGITSRIDLRNQLGAHYNDWADGIAGTDVLGFAENVLSLYSATHCLTCADWVRRSGSTIACRCGATVLTSTP